MEDIRLICEKYYAYVKGYALSLCFDETFAEDITQETFYKAMLHYDKFKGECRIETWLCGIARNLFLNSRRRKSFENIDDFIHLSDDACTEDSILKKEETDRVLSATLSLETPYKEVFYMRALGDFSYLVIAGVFGKTESWARVTYYRAKQKMIERMEENGEPATAEKS